ncbi:hypothetical protein XHC_2211 [Xanthomonas hortorum pv. carotae str. M081]|nr:hypothetical protein XHC_2211 [Xanthomonas hortorum pv. carotae str. M081]
MRKRLKHALTQISIYTICIYKMFTTAPPLRCRFALCATSLPARNPQALRHA